MVKSTLSKIYLLFMLAPVLTACESPHYVDSNGVRYYDANGVSTDTLPSGPYTKNGQYIINPEDATNTRDNRGSRPQGYGHDVNEDYSATMPPNTTVYGDGRIVTPDNRTVYPVNQTTTTTTTTIETQ